MQAKAEHRTLNTLILTLLLLAGTARGTEYLVATNGLDSNAGTNGWSDALRTISNAVAKAVTPGDIVTVSNGTYSITADIGVGVAITIRSFGNGVYGGLTNAASTILSRGGGRWNFNITAAATVDGFTGMGCSAGSAGNVGGNFYVSAGATVNNCVLRNNTGGYNTKGFGGYIVSGVISNCLIYGNYNTDRMNYGGGLWMDGGTVVACRIYNNDLLAVNNQTEGGGVYLNNSGAILRNCLIYGNRAQSGGGVRIVAGTVENCTIVTNSTAISGGGISRTGGTVRNCIVWDNTSADANKNIYNADANVTYTCTINPVSTGAGCISGDPKFVNPAANDYTLQGASPCLDVGTNQAWMAGAIDLAGNPRKVLGGVISADPVVDMGAYEYGWQATPIIKNQPASATTINSATLNGWLVSTGFSDTAVCVLWDTNNYVVSGAWPNTNWFTDVTWTNNSFPSTNMTGLTTERTYYYTYGASNAAGTVVATLPTNVMYLITGGVTVDSSGDNSAQYPSDMTGTFTISRPASASAEPLIVSYSTTNGSPTATNGIHYSLSGAGLLTSGTAPTGNVLIAAGATSATLTLTPLSQVPVNLSAILTVTPGAGNYALGVTTQQTVTLQAAASTVQFWTGAANNQWTNSANWTNSAGPGSVPTNATDNVVINGGTNQPIVLDLANGSITIASLALGQSIASTLSVQNGNVDTKILIVTNDVVIGQAGYLTHAAETAGGTTVGNENHRLCLVVSNNLTIAAGGQINVDGKGYVGQAGPGKGGGGGSRNGAGHGGEGAAGYGGSGGTTYGSISNPLNSGSGGGASDSGAGGTSGGGTVILRVGGAVTHDGVITAKGAAGTGQLGTGAGGSINLIAASLSGSGYIYADGGINGTPDLSGGGGGGRIAVVVTNASSLGSFANPGRITAYGGQAWTRGAAGTVFLKNKDQAYGDLIVNNNGIASGVTTLYTSYTNQFNTITATNQGVFAVGTNGVLVMDGCTLRTDSTTNSIASRFIVRDNGALSWTGTWTNNGCISWYGSNYINVGSGSLVVASGAILTHESGPTHAIRLNLAGDLTVQAGGAIWVKNCGYPGSTGPAGYSGAQRAGGAHGGQGGSSFGGTCLMTYDSVTNPVMAGGGSFYGSGPGGGVVIVNATGNVTVDGTIDAGTSEGAGAAATGAGGTVNIRAGQLLGSGRISVKSGDHTSDRSSGGGGRIAVVLTNAATFGGVTMSAAPGTTAGGGKAGAAGTIYLKGTNAPYGRLIIPATVDSQTTLIGPSVTDAVVGDVELQSGAKLAISNNCTLTVYGSWTNAAATNAISGGRVVLAGAAPATVWGGNTWSNLTIATAGKTVQFEAGKTQTVYGLPVLSNGVTLVSTATSNWWYLLKPGSGTQDVGAVTVRDSNATNGLTFAGAVGSVNGGNNVNWLFRAPKGTMLLVW